MPFNNFPSPEEVYNGSNDDIQREKRLNNYLRSYKMPSMLADTVQSAMIHNPYDRSAAVRAELAQQTANSMNIPWRTREAMANELFKATPIDATSGDGAAPGSMNLPRTPRSATQSVGPVVGRGNINGQDVAVPTAGNYMNGAYQGEMQRLGLGESPDYSSYQSAADNYKSPAQRQKEASDKLLYDRYIDAARIKANGQVDAAAMKGSKSSGKDATLKEYRKQLGVDDKERAKHTNELYAAYERYIRSEPGETQDFDTWSTHDPVAQVINQKFQALAAGNGRSTRENQSVIRSAFAPGVFLPRIRSSLVQLATTGHLPGSEQSAIQPEAHSKIQSAVQTAIAQGATPEQLIEMGKQSGLGAAELALIQSEGERIRKAQFGAPATPDKGSSMSGDKGPAMSKSTNPQRNYSPLANGLDEAYRGAVYAANSMPTGYARGPQGTSNPYAPSGRAVADSTGRVHDARTWGVPQGVSTPSAEEAQRFKNADYDVRRVDGSIEHHQARTYDPYIDYRGFPERRPDPGLLDALIRSIMQRDSSPYTQGLFRSREALTT